MVGYSVQFVLSALEFKIVGTVRTSHARKLVGLVSANTKKRHLHHLHHQLNKHTFRAGAVPASKPLLPVAFLSNNNNNNTYPKNNNRTKNSSTTTNSMNNTRQRAAQLVHDHAPADNGVPSAPTQAATMKSRTTVVTIQMRTPLPFDRRKTSSLLLPPRRTHSRVQAEPTSSTDAPPVGDESISATATYAHDNVHNDTQFFKAQFTTAIPASTIATITQQQQQQQQQQQRQSHKRKSLLEAVQEGVHAPTGVMRRGGDGHVSHTTRSSSTTIKLGRYRVVFGFANDADLSDESSLDMLKPFDIVIYHGSKLIPATWGNYSTGGVTFIVGESSFRATRRNESDNPVTIILDRPSTSESANHPSTGLLVVIICATLVGIATVLAVILVIILCLKRRNQRTLQPTVAPPPPQNIKCQCSSKARIKKSPPMDHLTDSTPAAPLWSSTCSASNTSLMTLSCSKGRMGRKKSLHHAGVLNLADTDSSVDSGQSPRMGRRSALFYNSDGMSDSTQPPSSSFAGSLSRDNILPFGTSSKSPKRKGGSRSKKRNKAKAMNDVVIEPDVPIKLPADAKREKVDKQQKQHQAQHKKHEKKKVKARAPAIVAKVAPVPKSPLSPPAVKHVELEKVKRPDHEPRILHQSLSSTLTSTDLTTTPTEMKKAL